MSGLIPVEAFGGIVTQTGTDADYAGYGAGGGAKFTQSIRFSSKGKSFQGGKKYIAPGHYYVQDGDDAQDLGTEIDVLPLAKRRKALDFTNRDKIVVTHDAQSPEYVRIAGAVRDKSQTCAEGPSFLVYLRTDGRPYELFCATAGLQAASREISGFLPRTPADCTARGLDASEARGPMACTLGGKFKQTRYGTQHDPTVAPCSTPFASLPETAEMLAEMKKFVEAKANDVESVPDAQAPSRDR